MRRLFKTKEAADILNVTPETVRRMRRRGALKAVKVGRAVRFREEDVLSFLVAQPGGAEEMKESNLLTVKDLAKRLAVTTGTVYQLTENGSIPSIRIGKGRGTIRFRADDIEKYLSKK
jgi:excisionase family DNA binding protein